MIVTILAILNIAYIALNLHAASRYRKRIKQLLRDYKNLRYTNAIEDVITVADEYGAEMAIDACRNVLTNGAVDEVNNILNKKL